MSDISVDCTVWYKLVEHYNINARLASAQRHYSPISTDKQHPLLKKTPLFAYTIIRLIQEVFEF